ncbi:rhodanese-like domain-containing protein [Natronomonas sp. F2-12]|jgi:rhodanese-related sulfurtransferase|uniref:Rhodanese-like domain-containing protein n=1 Tax=Natronomonas aquatica TaxID=2841590 RepID=A0A9R1CT25_9EURY|nr:rhodanese-like domain-containing protein [Natronomonas aquatica]MCQ4333076.1 rhodanese-like domain-containing protein [Natronomonas aquatica]
MDGEISADELWELLQADEPIRIVDIRSPGQFRRGHIPGSENVPFAELTERIDELEGDDRVVTVCPHGQASVQAARLIDSFEGFEGRVESLETGIERWPHELATDGGNAPEDPDAPDAPF